jgi:hypothetical protein
MGAGICLEKGFKELFFIGSKGREEITRVIFLQRERR